MSNDISRKSLVSNQVKSGCWSSILKLKFRFAQKSYHKKGSMDKSDEDLNEDDDLNRRGSLASFVRLQYYNFANILPSEFSSDMVYEDEVNKFIYIPRTVDIHPDFNEFSFPPRNIPEAETIMAMLAMLEDLEMTYRWCITKSSLAKFVLMVQKGYRNLPYHNWRHAFSVAHFAYLTIKHFDLISYAGLSDVECFAFIISALCHDIDHRGTNNSFQVTSKSVLASLYSSESSVMEHHHLSQAIRILNIDGCDILSNLTSAERKQFLKHMKTFILATDIARHFRILPDLEQMVEYTFNKLDPEHHELVMCILITSCDLSDQTKDWESAVEAADSVYKEFFAQGDLERAMGKEPLEMMDRELAIIPAVQLRFVETIARPAYQFLQEIFPGAKEPLQGIKLNRKKWLKLKKKYEQYRETNKHDNQLSVDLKEIIQKTSLVNPWLQFKQKQKS